MDIQTLVKISETLIKHYPNSEVTIIRNRDWVNNWVNSRDSMYILVNKGTDAIFVHDFKSIKAFYRAITQEVRGNYKPLDTVGLISFNSIYYLDKKEEVAIKSFSKDTAILTDDRKVELNRLWIKE